MEFALFSGMPIPGVRMPQDQSAGSSEGKKRRRPKRVSEAAFWGFGDTPSSNAPVGVRQHEEHAAGAGHGRGSLGPLLERIQYTGARAEEENLLAEEKMFNPDEMQTIVDRLKAEGRMPTAEQFKSAIAEARAEYQKAVVKARKEGSFQTRKRRKKS
jgi:hypothetical protein